MNKVIVITGTRKGIGRYLAEYFLSKQMYVCGCSRNETDLQNPNYRHFCLDVADEKSVKKMVNNVYQEFKTIDVLINNAGIASMNHTLLTPLSTVEKIFSTNVFGTFLFCREVAKFMSLRKYGRIVNFSTVGVPLRLEGEATYTASKSAIEMLSKIMAKEYANSHITVNTIGPTPAKTDLIKNVPEEKIQTLLSKQAIKDFAGYKDILNVIEFYISEDSSMITGQTLYLGGLS